MFNPYLGKIYTDLEIEDALEQYKDSLFFKKCENKYLEAAKSLMEQKIIGWFQGRAECGPRALGNRSILADPRNAKMKDIINSRVKFREHFRPFAPSVIFEEQCNYFDLNIPSPYMLMVADILPEKRDMIKAVTHVDGTGRLQTVLRELNEEYYSLIQQFHAMSGVPIVLNTSFNVNGEPIVETPSDAIRCFLSSDFDVLFIHSYKIEKRG